MSRRDVQFAEGNMWSKPRKSDRKCKLTDFMYEKLRFFCKIADKVQIFFSTFPFSLCISFSLCTHLPLSQFPRLRPKSTLIRGS